MIETISAISWLLAAGVICSFAVLLACSANLVKAGCWISALGLVLGNHRETYRQLQAKLLASPNEAYHS